MLRSQSAGERIRRTPRVVVGRRSRDSDPIGDHPSASSLCCTNFVVFHCMSEGSGCRGARKRGTGMAGVAMKQPAGVRHWLEHAAKLIDSLGF